MRSVTPQKLTFPERWSLIIAAVLVLLVAVLSFQAWSALRKHSEELQLSQKIAHANNDLLSLLKDAETAQRGFLLTGDAHYLEPYQAALANIPRFLEDLEKMSDQRQRVQNLGELIRQKLEEMAETITLARSGNTAAALTIVRTDRGKRLMDQIRDLCAQIDSISNGKLARSSEESRSSEWRLGVIATFGSALLGILLISASVAIQRGIETRQDLIEDLRKSERRYRESRDWLDTTLRSVGDGVIVAGADARVLFLNPVATELTGWTQDEAAGLPIYQVFVIHNEETGAVVENPVDRALREGRIVGLANHTVLTAKNGRRIPIDDSAGPICIEGANVSGVVLVFRDVSERKQAEEQVALQSKRLAESNRELTTVNQRLSQVNAELESFAYAVSHDLQSPLRGVSQMAALLSRRLEHNLDAQSQNYLKLIQSSAKQMQTLITGLLEYSRFSDVSLAVEPTDCAELLSITQANLQTQIEQAGATLIVDPLPTVWAGDQLARVFQNLIDNALKYRGEKPPEIRISATRSADEWIVAVRDNGIGFDMKHADRIFDVFQRLHGGTQYEGSGVGLALCKRIVERYGGRIWAESVPGVGSTFYLNLAAFDSVIDSETPSTTPDPPSTLTPLDGSSSVVSTQESTLT